MQLRSPSSGPGTHVSGSTFVLFLAGTGIVALGAGFGSGWLLQRGALNDATAALEVCEDNQDTCDQELGTATAQAAGLTSELDQERARRSAIEELYAEEQAARKSDQDKLAWYARQKRSSEARIEELEALIDDQGQQLAAAREVNVVYAQELHDSEIDRRAKEWARIEYTAVWSACADYTLDSRQATCEQEVRQGLRILRPEFEGCPTEYLASEVGHTDDPAGLPAAADFINLGRDRGSLIDGWYVSFCDDVVPERAGT